MRVASADDLPVAPMSLDEAISRGTRLDELIALRLIVSGHVQNEQILGSALKALSIELREISKEIEVLSSSGEKDGLGKAADTGDEKFNPYAV